MTLVRPVMILLCVSVAAAWCDTPVIFIGLSGQGAPGIEKNLTRLMEEQFALGNGMTLVQNDESRRLSSRIDDFAYPTVTAPLATALRRFAPDSALFVWGRVRECSVKPLRRYFFTAHLQATLVVELTVFNLGTRSYAYIGDAKAVIKREKGFIFWFGRIEDGLSVSAAEKAELIELLQVEGAKSSGTVLQTLLAHTRSKNRGKEPSPGVTAKEISIEPASADDSDGVEEVEPAEKNDAVPEEESGEEPSME